ncbi:hypothetical protein F5Y19DRAFT_492239 [Xylariaceae sp. FL1651]|nr:hypothetical protein F5Y19DRAFT_492239 [Xylariaceae sp. FL1651]
MKGEEDQMESTRFLDDIDLPEKTRSHLESVRRKRFSYMNLVLHGSFITLYSIMFLFATLRNNHIATNHDVLRDMVPSSTIRLSPDDLARLGRPKGKVIQLPDGDYIGTLNVFHDLHCLRRVTRLLYESHYFPNITSEDRHLNLLHAQHCLDRLRQSIQCRGDISVATYLWDQRQAFPIANFTSLHECVNWDALHAWAHGRQVDVFEPGLLIHPTLGPAYASLNTNKTYTGILAEEAT